MGDAGRPTRIRADAGQLSFKAADVTGPNDIPKDQIDWSKYLPEPGFHVLERSWVVERTFAWLLFNRRLSRDYERLCTTSETWIYLAMIRLMLRMVVRMP
jgi:transposase